MVSWKCLLCVCGFECAHYNQVFNQELAMLSFECNYLLLDYINIFSKSQMIDDLIRRILYQRLPEW